MKIVQWLPVVLLAAGTCFGADPNCTTHPTIPSLQNPCPSILGQLSKAMDAMQDFQRASAEATAKIAAARQAYWKVFPDGPGAREAEFNFLKRLQEKDFVYLTYALPLGVSDPTVQAANIGMLDLDNLKKFPRNVDGGIRPYAFPLFVEWVNALRRAQGRVHDGAFTNPVIFAEAYTDQSNWRKSYED